MQAGVSGKTDAMYFIYSDSKDGILIRRYLPAEKGFDDWEESTGTEYGWLGVTAIHDEIHIISGRECAHNYDTMLKGIRVKR